MKNTSEIRNADVDVEISRSCSDGIASHSESEIDPIELGERALIGASQVLQKLGRPPSLATAIDLIDSHEWKCLFLKKRAIDWAFNLEASLVLGHTHSAAIFLDAIRWEIRHDHETQRGHHRQAEGIAHA